MRPIRLIVVHHSASPRETTVEQITEWHRARGWESIGYHLIVTGDGAVRSGRDLRIPGAHARGHNLASVGVCVTGNNTKAGDKWNEAQIAALRTVVAALLVQFPGAEVMGHRDLSGAHTECPGLDVRALLAEGVA